MVKDNFFCVALERFKDGSWYPELAYTHAPTSRMAELTIIRSEKPGSRYRIVGSAPVIGYKVEDSKGLILRT